MSARLGEILVALQACDAARVREALDSQVLFGGRLGTNLLEAGAVTEEAVARALAQQHGVRALYGEFQVDPAALATLPPAQADRLDVVPWQLSGRRLAVLCADPRQLRKLDEVAFATGKIVEAVVVPEARLWALLRRHYAVDRPVRAIEEWARPRRPAAPAPEAPAPEPAADLMDEAEFQALYSDRVTTGTPVPGTLRTVAPSSGFDSRPAAEPSRPRPWPPEGGQGSSSPPTSSPFPSSSSTPTASRTAAPPRPPPLPPRPEQSPDPFAGMLQSSDETLADLQKEATDAYALPGQERISVVSRAPGQLAALGFDEAVAALAGVADRGAIARIVLRYALSRFRRAVLLTVHGRGADGWEGMGEGLTPQTVARVHVPLGKPGVVQTVVESRSHVLGPLAKTEANIALLRGLGGGAPRTSFAMPVLARGQVVNVLYADDGRGRMVNPEGLGELLILAAKISQSYDLLLARAR